MLNNNPIVNPSDPTYNVQLGSYEQELPSEPALITFETSAELDKLYQAMAKVSLEIQNPKKTKKVTKNLKNGQVIEYWYAPLEGSYEEIRKVAPKNGICFFQDIETINSNIIITTEVGHESGQYRRTRVVAVVPDFTDYNGKSRKPTAQEYASSITYFRRYAINGCFAICGDDDDDGGEASKDAGSSGQVKKPNYNQKDESKKEPLKNHAPQTQPGFITFQQGNDLKMLGINNGWSVDDMTIAVFNVTGEKKWSSIEQKHLTILNGLFGKKKGE